MTPKNKRIPIIALLNFHPRKEYYVVIKMQYKKGKTSLVEILTLYICNTISRINFSYVNLVQFTIYFHLITQIL